MKVSWHERQKKLGISTLWPLWTNFNEFKLENFVLLAILRTQLFEIVNLLIWFFDGSTENDRGELDSLVKYIAR